MTDDEEIIGTGAIRKLEEGICELKRLWLLTEYQGKGLGYRMVQELLAIARGMGYQRIRLETDPVSQKPAMVFYKRLGFYEIPPYSRRAGEIAMEMIL
jgi:putative acetyltransferase